MVRRKSKIDGELGKGNIWRKEKRRYLIQYLSKSGNHTKKHYLRLRHSRLYSFFTREGEATK